MRRNRHLPLLLALALGTAACGDDGLEIYRSFFSTEPCEGAPEEACHYANIFFVLRSEDAAVTDLTADDVEMRISGRDVGVEGQKRLTTSNGLLVSLLLDTSYSITEAGAETSVKEAATAFVNSLPESSIISVARFASESTVPILVCSDGSFGTEGGRYESRSGAVETIAQHYDAYDTQTSSSQTKIFDAVGRFSGFSPTSPALKVLQKVMVVFTDGADTASVNYKSATETADAVGRADEHLKLYAIGMGKDVDAKALTTLSEGRFYAAQSAAELAGAFEEVGKDLSYIYQLRVLVAQVESGATGELEVKYGGSTRRITVAMSTSDPIPPPTPPGPGGGGTTGPLCK